MFRQLPAVLALGLMSSFARADDFPVIAATDAGTRLAGLHAAVTVLRDVDGVPHVYALDEHDALFMQGWLHAGERLFQMDYFRRFASGTLAELEGQASLPQDVELRTLGLRRAAERSVQALSAPVLKSLQAYADGVNARIAANPLPADYARLGLTRVEPWTPVDSVVIGKLVAFQLSADFDSSLTVDYLSYQQRLVAQFGADGSQLADALFFLDVFRSAPFDPASTVPDSGVPVVRGGPGSRSPGASLPSSAAGRLLGTYRDRLRAIPALRPILNRRQSEIGSNEWAVAGSQTRDGRPLIANDPHLSLPMPSNFYDQQLKTLDGLDLIGSAFPGIPLLVLGQNRFISWGSTTTGYDVTDMYEEKVVPDATSPSGLATLYRGQREAVLPIPVTFKVNLRIPGQVDQVVPVPASAGLPPVVLIVPRHGPIVQLDVASGTAISFQWAGAGATREVESYWRIARSQNLAQFKAALQYFDVGSQNFVYGDVGGHIAYLASGEVPLREDLQAGTVKGAPPWLVRNGQGGNEWLRPAQPAATAGTGYRSLPFAELPQVVDPAAGFFVNANNDPLGLTLDNNPLNQLRSGGQGIYYLGAYGFDYGLRAARITEMLRQRLARGPVDADDMRAIQADVTLFDAKVLAPRIVAAFDSARASAAPAALRALAADPRVAEAVHRLRHWSYQAPTGIANGYDAADRRGRMSPPSRAEIDASIAATIYSVWRAQAIANGVDRTLNALGVPLPGGQEALKALRHLLDRDGIGLSTVDFFGWVPLADAAQRRDAVLLQSLKDALDLLAGPAFARAFAGSTHQDDYRWGKLHRIVLGASSGLDDYSIPGGTPGLPPSVDGLPGLAVDGGLATVDVGDHDVRAADDGAFMFDAGPNRRYVGSLGRAEGSIEARSILPGGESGVLGDRFYANMLGRWLTNDTYPFRSNLIDVLGALDSRTTFRPAR